MTISYHGKNKSFRIVESELLAVWTYAKGRSEITDSIGMLFGGVNAELGETSKVLCGEMRRAVKNLLAMFEDSKGFVIYTGEGFYEGARKGNYIYHFEFGFNLCTMIIGIIDAEGKYQEVKREDIRDREFIETDNVGVLRVVKKRKPGHMFEMLKEVQSVLEKIPSDHFIDVVVG